jgi:hypothetical protein
MTDLETLLALEENAEYLRDRGHPVIPIYADQLLEIVRECLDRRNALVVASGRLTLSA